MSCVVRRLVVSLLAGLTLPGRASGQTASYGARASVRAEAALGSTGFASEQANERPGVLGDPARALLDAPGAARSGFLGSELILWGALPSETRTYVDGVEIPSLFHPAGLRTTVHPALIEHVSLIPGALPAEYGRSLGGAVELQTKSPTVGVGTQLRADAIDSSLSAHAGNAVVRALVGLRYGYFDRVLSRLAPRSEGILAVPAHQDGVARLTLQSAPGSELSATWIGARDRLAITTDRGRQARTQLFHVGSLRLDRRYDDGARVRITPFVGFSSSSEASRFDEVPLSVARRGLAYGLRADYRRSFAALTLRLGVDARGTRERIRRSGTLSLPAREGDVRAFGQAPVDALDRDSYRVTQLNIAPWLSLALRFGQLLITPGLRVETYMQSAERTLPVTPGAVAVGHDALFLFAEPRLGASYQALSWLRLEARVGLYHQLPDGSELSASFGTPTLSPARALHGSLGASLVLPQDVTLDLIAFDKSLHALAVRTTESPPPIAHALVAHGRGTARGLSVALRREFTRTLFFSANYTLSRSQRSDPNGRLRLFDYDQTHVLSALLGFSRGGFLASARTRAATGMPRTEVVGAYLDAKSGFAQPLFGAHNGSRLPTYVALDLHIEYGFLLSVMRASVFVDVLNATDRTNVEDFAYAENYARRRDLKSIPIVAMAGANLRFGDE